MHDEIRKKTRSEKNINTASIEELVNSSLDLAAEEVLKKTSPAVEDEPDQEILTEEAPATEVQTEFDVASEEEIEEAPEPKEISESKHSKTSDLDELLDMSEMESELVFNPDMQAEEKASETEADFPEAENTTQSRPIDELIPLESIETLENEVSQLETEIQIQMDKLVVKSDHLKANIQSELKRVCANNEQLQQQVTELTQQLSDAEEKIQALAEVQNRQQITIQKLISILKGINVKITHLYDEK